MKVFGRLRAMDADELRFRLASETRKAAERARASFSPPAWERSELARLLHTDANASADLRRAGSALARRDWAATHRALSEHFARRPTRFPISPAQVPSLTGTVQARFPDARSAASRRADRMLAGRYDVLGYDDVDFGVPPNWYADPVHGQQASTAFWSDVEYLDPKYGDHKITWEINRHQHWFGLARAFHLTSDRRYYEAVVDQLENWMAVNPPLRGANWASMLEIGFRSLSWMWTLHFFAGTAAENSTESAPWTVDLLLGLNRQLEHVARHLSRYFSPNTHLTGEALALYVAGQALPELRNSERWAALGREVLLQETRRQILSDGGHAELSAHYHRYTTDFYLLALQVARLTNDPSASQFEDTSRRLASYLRDLADDNGRLPLLGDDDGGQLFPICRRPPWDCRDTLAAAAVILREPGLAVSTMPEEVFWLCGTAAADTIGYEQSARRSVALADSGYFVSRTVDGDHLVFDAGRHGFLNGGHAHADALSLVLTVRGRPLLVDAGTGTYTMDATLRNELRSTSLHNTVVVDGQPQSSPRGSFHWHTTTDARATAWHSRNDIDFIEGRHDGYGGLTHARVVAAIRGFGWLVIDHLLGARDASAETLWHIHPSWHALLQQGHLVLRCDDAEVLLASSDPLEPAASLDDSLNRYSPIYGRVERGICVRTRTRGLLPRSWLTLIAATDDESSGERVAIDSLPVTHSPPGWRAAAFRLSSSRGQFLILSAVPSGPKTEASGEPAELWGCEDIRTDGRFVIAHATDSEALHVRIGGTRTTVASSVHF